tara:strand:- start:160 stop:414 length:255 start_codon:yes stop_codon:yes gene_type:complete
MKTILISLLLFFSVSIAQGTETDIEAMNDMNRHHFDNGFMGSDMEESKFAMDEIKKKKKKKKKKMGGKGKKKKKGFFSKVFGSK